MLTCAGNLVSASATHTPLAVKGTAIIVQVRTIDSTEIASPAVRTGIMRCRTRLATVVSANTSALWASCWCTRSGRKRSGSRYTRIAPTVIPSMEIEMARKAKWYQMVTLKMRVSRIWYASVARVTRKSPA